MIAKRLFLTRKKRGLTQIEIANRLGIPRTTYNGYELGNNEPNFKTLVRIADFLDVSVDYLLGREEEKMNLNACSDNIRNMDIPNVGIFTSVFPYKIKELRHIRNMTQRELASDLGFAQTTYSQYELGKRQPEFDVLVRISDYFNVTTDYLLGRTDDSSPLKCNTEQKIKCPVLCDNNLMEAYQIGIDDQQAGLECDLSASESLKKLLAEFSVNGYACALMGEAWTKGWLSSAARIWQK